MFDSARLNKDLSVPNSDAVRAIEAVSRIESVPTILRLVRESTGMGFAAISRTAGGRWTACAVNDGIGLGIAVGDQFELRSTLCAEAATQDRVTSLDAALGELPNGVRSHASAPIELTDGSVFGTLCAADREPGLAAGGRVSERLRLCAELVAQHLRSDGRLGASELARLDERAAADLREHFIAVLGHDLRNPIAAMAGAAQLARRATQEPKVLRALEMMRGSIARMSALIDDVMDLARSRLGGGGIGARIVQIDDLAASLRQVVDEQRSARPDRPLVDKIEIGCPVDCDPRRIQQLLSNLLGNALAHGAVDEPIVALASTDGDWISISVENGGPPIEPAVMAKMFEPYWRPAESAPGGGLGLGLYICAQIAQAHGGRMSASCADGRVRFSARLPVRH